MEVVGLAPRANTHRTCSSYSNIINRYLHHHRQASKSLLLRLIAPGAGFAWWCRRWFALAPLRSSTQCRRAWTPAGFGAGQWCFCRLLTKAPRRRTLAACQTPGMYEGFTSSEFIGRRKRHRGNRRANTRETISSRMIACCCYNYEKCIRPCKEAIQTLFSSHPSAQFEDNAAAVFLVRFHHLQGGGQASW